MSLALDALQDVLKSSNIKCSTQVSLAEFSTIRAGGACAIAVYPKGISEFAFVISVIHRLGLDYVVVGGGSNLLPCDGIFEGVVIKTTEMKAYSEAEYSVSFLCGARLSYADTILKRKFGFGLPRLCGIPGTVGGAVCGNAGAYGDEVSNHLIRCTVLDTKEGKMYSLTASDIAPAYRYTLLKDSELILLDCELSADITDGDDNAVRLECKAKRLASQPIAIPSLGSYFKRAGGVGAGYYIDRAGLKGYRVGGALVSTVHAGFIVNSGGATASQIEALSRSIKDNVKNKFGIELAEEIRYFRDIIRR